MGMATMLDVLFVFTMQMSCLDQRFPIATGSNRIDALQCNARHNNGMNKIIIGRSLQNGLFYCSGVNG